MNYVVKYKKTDSYFWKKFSGVMGDFIATDMPNAPRVLMLVDGSRIEIPMDGMMFNFSGDRKPLVTNADKKTEHEDKKRYG